MKQLILRFLGDERGATAVEYGLICALIFLVIVGSLTLFGNTSSGIFNTAMNTLSAAMAGG